MLLPPFKAPLDESKIYGAWKRKLHGSMGEIISGWRELIHCNILKSRFPKGSCLWMYNQGYQNTLKIMRCVLEIDYWHIWSRDYWMPIT